MTDPTWAGRTATPPTPDRDDERAGWLPIVGVVAALGLVGAGGYVLGSGGDAVEAAPSTTAAATVDGDGEVDDDSTADDATTTAPSTTVVAEDDDAADADGADDASSDGGDDADGTDGADESASDGGDDAAGAADDADPGSTDDTDTEDAGDAADGAVEHHVVIEEGETRGAVLSGGILYLGGSVPSREVADTIIERAAAIVGEENIVDEYIIDPDAPLAHGAPLYVEDTVLFAYGESTYDPQFEPLLDLGLALLHNNPDVTVTIITHTDSSGSAHYNDLLSYRRGQSVAQYWVDRGVAVERIVIDARGEREPVADNGSEEGAQLNRRAEFYIEGLLG